MENSYFPQNLNLTAENSAMKLPHKKENLEQSHLLLGML